MSAKPIDTERLMFESGSVEARAFALLHAGDADEARCALCLLAWLARALAEPEQRVDTLVEEARALVARQFGMLGSVCFDALLHPDREAERDRLECFERYVHIQRLESLPMPPKERLN